MRVSWKGWVLSNCGALFDIHEASPLGGTEVRREVVADSPGVGAAIRGRRIADGHSAVVEVGRRRGSGLPGPHAAAVLAIEMKIRGRRPDGDIDLHFAF